MAFLTVINLCRTLRVRRARHRVASTRLLAGLPSCCIVPWVTCTSCDLMAPACVGRESHHSQCILTSAVGTLLEIALGAGHLVGYVRKADNRFSSCLRERLEGGTSISTAMMPKSRQCAIENP